MPRAESGTWIPDKICCRLVKLPRDGVPVVSGVAGVPAVGTLETVLGVTGVVSGVAKGVAAARAAAAERACDEDPDVAPLDRLLELPRTALLSS